MVRNSTKYVSYKDLKKIYSAVNEDEALEALDEFGQSGTANTQCFNDHGKRIKMI